MITKRAVCTMLYALGMNKALRHRAIVTHTNYFQNTMLINEFEEIRHHEIRLEYPAVYEQNHYMGMCS